MVIPEAREQIKQQQEKIRQQEESFRKAKEQLAQVSPKVTLTQSELLKQTPQTMVGVQAEEFRRQLEKTKVGEKLTQQEQEYLKQIEPYKQQLAAREEAISGYESQLAAHQRFEEARKTGRVSNLALYGSGLAKELAQEYMKKRSWQTREYQKQYDEYKQQLAEQRLELATALQKGKDVYYTPEGAVISDKVLQPIDLSKYPTLQKGFGIAASLTGIAGIPTTDILKAGRDVSGKISSFVEARRLETKRRYEAGGLGAIRSYIYETKPKPDVELSSEVFAQQEALAQQYAMGEKFTLRYPTRYLGRQISKKIGDITGKTEAEIEEAFRQTPFFVSPFTEKKITMGQLEPVIKLLEPIAQTLLLFQIFSPAFMKGEYGKSDYIYDYTKKKWVLKSKLQTKQVLEFAKKGPTKADIKTLEDNLRNAYLQGDIQHIREAYRTALNTGNKDLIKSSETLLRNALGKETAGTIIKDIKAQEIIPAIKDITKPSIDLLSPKVADLPLTPEIAAASIWTGTGLYERTITPEEEFLKSREQFIIEPVAPKSRFTEMTGLFVSPKFKDLGVLGVSPRIAVALKQPLRFKQPAKTREALRIGLGVITALGLRTGQILKTRQIQKPVSPTITTGTLKIPTIKIPKFLIPFKKKKKKKLKKEKAFEFEFVIPYGRRYGKFMPIGKPTTIKKAKAKGISFLRRTLGATIELRKAKTGEKIKVGAIGKGFRLGKKGKDPFQLVQRKTFRLGTRAERVALVRARRRGFKFI